MPTYRMTIEYDGTEFVGWQFQKNGRSVQETIEKGIRKILQTSIRIAGGGRTDAGVHATGQVASFRCEMDLDLGRFEHSLNAVMPHDVVVFDIQKTASDFHARHSATSRSYEYSVCAHRCALHRNYRWSVYQQLNCEAMQFCANQITGDHDFRAFCKTVPDAVDYRCTVERAAWIPTDDGLKFEIKANRFLHGMVRALVGTMVDIGRAHTPLEEFSSILACRDRSKAGMSAPAKGLCLTGIFY